MQKKQTIVVYYGDTADIAEAKHKAALVRGEGHNAIVVDANSFQDIEQADGLVWVGDVSDSLKDKISEAYKAAQTGRRKVKEIDVTDDDDDEESGPGDVEIPENFAELNFAELNKIATAISGEAVRSKAAAIEVIEAELDRRKETGEGADDDQE